jgi:Protein of unknown function (DUF2730)
MMEVRDYVAIISLALTVFTLFAAFFRASKDEVRKHGDRLTLIESQLSSLPSKDSFHKLELDVSEVKGSMRVLEEGLKPLAASMARIERFMDHITFEAPAKPRVVKK